MASPFSSPEYMAFLAQRKRAMGIPFTNSNAYRPNVPTPVIGAGGGTGQAPNTAIPHVGGDTWEMNSNRDGQQFNGPSGFKASFAGGGDQGDRMHGYEGAGLNTRDFSQMTGRAPTASDVEMAQGGGLAPTHPQMGSLDSYYAMLRGPSQWQQLQAGVPLSGGGGGVTHAPIPTGNAQGTTFDPEKNAWVPSAGNPMGTPPLMSSQNPAPVAPTPYRYTPEQPWLLADKSNLPKDFDTGFRMAQAGRGTGAQIGGAGLITPEPTPYRSVASRPRPLIPMLADGGDAPAGQPVIVGERGPEMIVPKKDMTVIPNEYLPTQHLMRGDILEYLKRHMR